MMKRYESKDVDDRQIVKCGKCDRTTKKFEGFCNGWIVKGDSIICPGCPVEE